MSEGKERGSGGYYPHVQLRFRESLYHDDVRHEYEDVMVGTRLVAAKSPLASLVFHG